MITQSNDADRAMMKFLAASIGCPTLLQSWVVDL